MKFSQIKIGDKFIWKHEIYTKTSPLVASNSETSATKMVPKYVNIELVDSVAKDKITLDTPDDLFNYFVNKFTKNIESSSLSDSDKELVLKEIDNIKQDVLKKIES